VFRFRLQRLLDFRRNELDTQRLTLSRLEAQIAELARERVALQQRRDSLDREHRAPNPHAIGVLGLRRGLAELQTLLVEDEQLVARIAELSTHLEHARRRVLEAHRRVRSLERLTERRQADYEAEMRAQDRKNSDEHAGRRGRNPFRPSAKPAPSRHGD